MKLIKLMGATNGGDIYVNPAFIIKVSHAHPADVERGLLSQVQIMGNGWGGLTPTQSIPSTLSVDEMVSYLMRMR